MANVQEKVWPVTVQLEAWFLFDKLDGKADPLPEDIQRWITEFRKAPLTETHARLHAEYKTFAEIFYGPNEGPQGKK